MKPYNEFIHIKNQDQPIITGTVLVKFCSLFQIPALLSCECFSINIFSSEFRNVICWATGPRDGPDHPECLLRWCKVWRAFLAGSVPLDFQQLEIDNMKCGIVWRSRTFLWSIVVLGPALKAYFVLIYVLISYIPKLIDTKPGLPDLNGTKNPATFHLRSTSPSPAELFS